MSRGKYLSLEEARKQDKLKQFIKEHDSKGNKKAFEDCLDKMSKKGMPKKKKNKKKDTI